MKKIISLSDAFIFVMKSYTKVF